MNRTSPIIALAIICLSLSAAPAPIGRQRVSFTEKSPLSAIPELTRRMDLQLHETSPMLRDYDPSELEHIQLSWQYELDRQSFEVIVPAVYLPTKPAGLLVWMGNVDLPKEYLEPLARQNIILVTAVGATDRTHVVQEALALDAVHNLKKRYKLDDRRIYIAGFGSGAQLATWLLRAYPDVFAGGYFLMGGWFYERMPNTLGYYTGKRDEHPDPPAYPSAFTIDPQWKGNLQKIKKETKIVMLRGQNDDSLDGFLLDGELQFKGLCLDGFTRATYLEVPDWQHRPPDDTWFEKGLQALEAQPKPVPTTAPTKDPNPDQSQIDQAYRLLATAPANGSKMRSYIEQVLKNYPTTPAAKDAQDALAWLDQREKKSKR